MTHYRLLTELPPRPVVPGPPPISWTTLWARCREELDEPSRAALRALRELDDATPVSADVELPAQVRARLERADQRAQDSGSALLGAWAAHDRGLREALAALRAAALGRSWPAAAPDVADAARALAPAAQAVMSIVEPGQRQRALDALRLRVLDQLVVDELGTDALLARILAAHIVERWRERPGPDPLEEVWT